MKYEWDMNMIVVKSYSFKIFENRYKIDSDQIIFIFIYIHC